MNPTIPVGDLGMYTPGPGISVRDVDTYRARWVKDWIRVGITERSAHEYADLLRGMVRMNEGLDAWIAAGSPPRDEVPDLVREIHLGHDDMTEAALTLREWGDGIPQLWVEKVTLALDDSRLWRMYDDCARCQDHAARRAEVGEPPRRPVPGTNGRHLRVVADQPEEGREP